MRPIITDLQKIPPLGLSIMAPYTAWGLWVRNTMFWLLTNSGIVNVFQRLFGGAAGHVDKYDIPDYEWKE